MKKSDQIKTAKEHEQKAETYAEENISSDDDTKNKPHLSDDEMWELAKRITQYCAAQSDAKYYPYQQLFAERFVYDVLMNEGDEITALFSRQSGKTETVAVVTVGLIVILPLLSKFFVDERLTRFKKGVRIGTFGPTYDQVAIMYKRMRERLYSPASIDFLLDPDIGLDMRRHQTKEIRLPNGSFIGVHSAAPGTKIEGETYDILLLEETQDINSQKIRKSIHPMGAACIQEGSLIHIQDGRVIPIEDFDIKDATGCYDNNFKFKQKHPLEVIDSGVQECLKITLNSGKEITGTYDHPLLYKPRNYPRVPVWEELQNLKIGHQIGVPSEVPFFGTDSIGVDDARILGMLVGDGSYGKSCSPAYYTEDKVLQDFWEGWVERNGGFCRLGGDGHITKKGNLFVQSVCAGMPGNKGENPAINLLRENGIYGQVRKQKRVPKHIWTAPKEEVAAFLGGFYDTDGCVVLHDNRRAEVSLSQSNKDILLEVSHLLMKFGIQSNIDKKVLGKGTYGKVGGTYYVLTTKDKLSFEAFTDNIQLLVPHKARNLIKGVELFKGHRSKRRASIIKGTGKNRKAVPLDYDLTWERVVKIEYAGKQRVYDIAMPDQCHNFIANNIVVHNTSATLVKIGTPNPAKNDFFEACMRNRSSDRNNAQKISHSEGHRHQRHFQFDYKTAMKYSPQYAKYIKKEIMRLGEDSDDFRMSYKLEWLLERGRFAPPEVIDKCSIQRTRNLQHIKNGSIIDEFELTAGRVSSSDEEGIVAAIDFGRAYSSTVITVAKVWYEYPYKFGKERRFRTHILDWLELKGDSHELQHPLILEFLAQYPKLFKLIVDATGKGDPIYSRLEADLKEDNITVIPFLFNRQSKHDGYTCFGQELNNQRFTFPVAKTNRNNCTDNFLVQLGDLQKTWKDRWLIVEKPDMPGAKDDYCDSAMMLCWAVNKNNTTVTSTDNQFFDRGGNPFMSRSSRSRRGRYARF